MMLNEKQNDGFSGWGVGSGLLLTLGFSLFSFITNLPTGSYASQASFPWGWLVLAAISLFLMSGFFIVNPNEAVVLQLFGNYVGTAKTAGLRWTVPFYKRTSLSLKIRNFESTKLKVNDKEGSPIEIGAVVVWKIVNTAEALFQVDRYEDYVLVQTESAVRHLAMSYSYDAQEAGQVSLHGSPDNVSEDLKKEIQERLSKAGVEVLDARLTHLAYSPEIAASMLQRQQAGAIIAARQRIVEGAVGMVQQALHMLKAHEIVELDEERKAAMVSNLLVVLCSERSTQPIVNTGTLYQ